MTYAEQHAALVADLKGKVERCDWHGVSDAANDLRVLEAEKHGRPGDTRCLFRDLAIGANEVLQCVLKEGHHGGHAFQISN